MAEPTDMIMPMLIEMRAEIYARLDKIEARLTKIEETQRSFRHGLSAEGLLSRLVIGEYEERIEALETRVNELEAAR